MLTKLWLQVHVIWLESQFFVIYREREREAHAISYKFIPKVTLHLQHPSLPLRAILVSRLLHRQRRNCENLFLVLFLYFSSDNKLLLNQSYSIFILFPFLTHFWLSYFILLFYFILMGIWVADCFRNLINGVGKLYVCVSFLCILFLFLIFVSDTLRGSCCH